MRGKIAALTLCVLLVIQMALPPVRAAESVYFVAAGSNVLPLSDETMPFWSGGYLYVSSTIFTGTVWKELGIAHVPANARQPLILYSGDDRSLMFDPDEPFARDPVGNTYYPGAVWRGGKLFVPASLVTSYFGLQYSVIPNVEYGYLVWLRQPGYGLSDKDFADAATYPMAYSYAQYVKAKEQAGQQPAVELPLQEEKPASRGSRVYLCLRGGDTTAELLDVLEKAHAQAAFFCSLEFLATQGDLLRRLAAAGQTVGILVDAEDGRRTVEEQLEQGNLALHQATCQKTRLAYVEGGDAASVQAAEAAGFRCLYPDLDRSGYSLRGAANAEGLLQRVSERKGSVTVWLDETASAGGLWVFLSKSQEAGNRLLALTETA